MNLSKLILPVLLVALLFSLGCVNIGGDQKSLEDFSKLEQKYFVKEAFSTNPSSMNDYISELSLLRSHASGSSAKVMEAEIYSAESFYYLNKALTGSISLNYQSLKCSSVETKQVISSITDASLSVQKAIEKLQSLSETEKSYLRVNQLDLVKGFSTQINQIKQFFENKC